MVDYIGKVVEIKGKGNVFSGLIKGTVLPNENKDLIVLKLSSGYNIAVKQENIAEIKVIGEAESSPMKPKVSNVISEVKGLPKVAIISLGGTISSRVDYKTGGVSSQFTSEDLVNAIPEIKALANIECISLMSKFSENLGKEDYLILAKKIEDLSKDNYDGYIIAQGTDTLHYVSSALSFLLNANKPIVFVGAQRSSDRPSSDAAYNFIGALAFIKASAKGGVFVAMHNTINDNEIAIHLGVKVRKLHTTRRDAFKSINVNPVALVDLDLRQGLLLKSEIKFNSNCDSLTNISEGLIKAENKLGKEVCLLKFYPSMDEKLFDFVLSNNKIVILEGTGLGHISDNLIAICKKHKDCSIFMTSQCISGRVNLNVYSTGKDQQTIGIMGLEDMLPETAYTKALYVLGQTNKQEEIKKLMLANLKHEITERTLYIE